MRRFLAAALLCCACEMGGAWAVETKQGPPVVLLVRQPQADVASAGMVAPLLGPPQTPADGSEARPYTTLRAALLAAPAGALLRIEDGIWRERLSVQRPVVLMGRGPGRTRIVSPEGSGPAIEVRGADQVQIYGMSIEGGQIGAQFSGGSGHRLENVEISGSALTGLVLRGAEMTIVSSQIASIAKSGRGIDVDGGSLEARRVVMRAAGRRAIVVRAARALLEDLDVRGSALSALQATEGAEVRVVRGVYDGQGGAAMYAGRARLLVEGAQVRHDEFAVIGYRGAELSVTGGELTDYRVAAVAMVNSSGSVQKVTIARGGTEAAISITHSGLRTPVLLADNRIRDPGTMGVHVTESSVTARGNAITGARLDREKDMGDAFYAIDSELIIESNVLRGNAGSGIAALRSRVQLSDNGFIENGRAGLLLLDRSRGTARSNVFERNAQAGVELGEMSRATLSQNRFGGNVHFDIDTGCGGGLAGSAEIAAGNTFAAPMRRRNCD